MQGGRPALRVAWYRSRGSFARRLGGYLSIIVVVGLIGGVAMGSIAAARRTQSSYPAFLASTNPSDLSISGNVGSSTNNSTTRYSDALRRRIARLPGVKRVEAASFVNAAPLAPDGAPRLGAVSNVGPLASIDGLFFDQDRPGVVAGRLASPGNPGEVMMDAQAARDLGAHLGETIPIGIYSGAQTRSPRFGTPGVRPAVRIDAKLVGIIVLSNEVVRDDIDRSPDLVIFTPALGHLVLGLVNGAIYGVQLTNGSQGVAAAERELAQNLPPGFYYQFHVTSNITDKVQSSVKPETIALGAFGAIAAIAALLIGLQVVSRQLRSDDEDLQVLRALGASPASVVLDGCIGVLGAIVAGSLLALAVAVTLSPLAPLGPIRPVYPHRGIAADWAVLGLGLAVLVGGLGTSALAVSYLGAPHRAALRARASLRHAPRPVALAASSGLPAPAVVGFISPWSPARAGRRYRSARCCSAPCWAW